MLLNTYRGWVFLTYYQCTSAFGGTTQELLGEKGGRVVLLLTLHQLLSLVGFIALNAGISWPRVASIFTANSFGVFDAACSH